jgi:hypothetical protein
VRSAIVIFLCLFVLLATGQNSLRLFTADGSLFKAYLNDSALNKTAQASVFAGNIPQDTVSVSVEFENSLRGEQQIYLLEKGKPVTATEFNYMVEVKNNKVRFTYTGTQNLIKLPEPLVPPKPAADTLGKYRNNILAHFVELRNGQAFYFNNIPRVGECKTPMPQEYLNYMQILMSRAQSEDDRFKIAENTALNNCVSVSQMNNILGYIPFEIEKLKLIKLYFHHVVNKEKKKDLDSTFRLEASKKELASFLKNTDVTKLKTDADCSVPAPEGEFKQFYTPLTVYSNDYERYDAMKKTYYDHCFSVNQIKSLLSLYIHDRERIDAAKLLYFYCVDKANFLDISEVFSYTTSVADMKQFVEKQKN